MKFSECVFYAFDNKSLVAEFDRLRGTNLSCSGAPIDLMVDEASGRRELELRLFVEFVKDVIWDRIPHE